MTVDAVGLNITIAIQLGGGSVPFAKAWVVSVCVCEREMMMMSQVRFCSEGALSSSLCSKLVRFSKGSRTSVASI